MQIICEFQVLIIREKLAGLYESEQQWSKAAQMLSGIDLDSGMRSGSLIFSLLVGAGLLQYFDKFKIYFKKRF